MVDAADSKSADRKVLSVRVRPPVPVAVTCAAHRGPRSRHILDAAPPASAARRACRRADLAFVQMWPSDSELMAIRTVLRGQSSVMAEVVRVSPTIVPRSVNILPQIRPSPGTHDIVSAWDLHGAPQPRARRRIAPKVCRTAQKLPFPAISFSDLFPIGKQWLAPVHPTVASGVSGRCRSVFDLSGRRYFLLFWSAPTSYE